MTSLKSLFEGNLDFDRTISRLKVMHDHNRDSEARILAAKLVGNKYLVRAYSALNELHEAEGHMMPSMTELQNYYDQKLREHAEKVLTKTQLEKFHEVIG